MDAYTQDSPEYTKTFYKTLRQGKGYIFFDEFNNKEQAVYLWNFTVAYREQFDYNQSESFPKFHWTDTIKKHNYKVEPYQSIKYIEAQLPYKIKAVPAVKSHDNLILKYTVTYSYDKDGKDKRTFTACVHYAISWCGDGIIDTDWGEECDDGNSVDDDQCSCNCNKVNVKLSNDEIPMK
jgi:cysteine-rich repeat protein